MDPLSCIEDLLDAIVKKDVHAAEIAASDLNDWLTKGGFLPSPSDLVERLSVIVSEYHNRK